MDQRLIVGPDRADEELLAIAVDDLGLELDRLGL
jgi:hypothetical protein